MILQTRASTLTTLMATEGGKCPHLKAIQDAMILARAEAETSPDPDNVSNDRTTLEHFKKKED